MRNIYTIPLSIVFLLSVITAANTISYITFYISLAIIWSIPSLLILVGLCKLHRVSVLGQAAMLSAVTFPDDWYSSSSFRWENADFKLKYDGYNHYINGFIVGWYEWNRVAYFLSEHKYKIAKRNQKIKDVRQKEIDSEYNQKQLERRNRISQELMDKTLRASAKHLKSLRDSGKI